MDRLDIKPSDVSSEVDIPLSTIYKILQGYIQNPRILTLVKLADFFKVPLDDLIGREISPIEGENVSQIPIYTEEELSHLDLDEYKLARRILFKMEQTYLINYFGGPGLLLVNLQKNLDDGDYCLIKADDNCVYVTKYAKIGSSKIFETVGKNLTPKVKFKNQIVGKVIECTRYL